MYLEDDPALKVFIDISDFLPSFYFYCFHCIMHAFVRLFYRTTTVPVSTAMLHQNIFTAGKM